MKATNKVNGFTYFSYDKKSAGITNDYIVKAVKESLKGMSDINNVLNINVGTAFYEFSK